MPFIPHTPESILPRADSKNPATTCKGITSSGRACRRALAPSPGPSPKTNRTPRDGVLAVFSADEDHAEGAAAFFCWQHKEQASVLLAGNKDGRKGNVVDLKQRTSVDTLVDRLGILELNSDVGLPDRVAGKSKTRPARKEILPKKWQDVHGPLIAVSGKGSSSEKHSRNPSSGRKPSGESKLFLSLLCCVRYEEPRAPLSPPVQHRRRESAEFPVRTARVPSYLQPNDPHTTPTPAQRRHSKAQLDGNRTPNANPTTPNRPALRHDPSSHTQTLLSLFPTTLSPQTTALLLAELAKPISLNDEEGYIYMFWLTPSAVPVPTAAAASSLLASPMSTAKSRLGSGVHFGRRTSELACDYAPASSSMAATGTNDKPTLLLKIGRASNVQRRMNEWSRQCGYTLSLIRYYPYLPSSSASPPSPSLSSPLYPSLSPNNGAHPPLKVPHAHKVERLIHLELADRRVKRGCETCGREHREWFEVEGSREGVGRVDAVVRRWVGWGLDGGLGKAAVY